MADRKLDICAWCSAATWCEVRGNGQPQCAGCKAVFFFRWMYAHIGFEVLGWQEKILRDLYGTVRVDTGAKRYRRGYVSMAKKNGKTFLLGGMPIYHLTQEGIERPEAYGGASSRDQAGLVYKAAAHLVNANPALKDKLNVLPSTKRIVRRDLAGFYAVLSADGKFSDGIEPSLALIDELHRWETVGAETLYEVITKGMISRPDALGIEITTAGQTHKSILCSQEYEYAKQVLAGTAKDDRFYAAIWEADEAQIAKDPKYWKSREARIAANPSHEDLGGFLKDEEIVGELNKAITIPAKKSGYLRFHLNVWVQSESTPAIPMEQWDACPMPWKAEGWPLSHDFLAHFVERPCWIGVDLSASQDLTAVSLVFPTEDGSCELLPFCWITEKALRQLEHLRWLTEGGFVERVEGNLIDFALIEERIRWAIQMFDVKEVCFDPWGDKSIVTRLIKDGANCIEVPQGYATMSPMTKHFLGLIAGGKLIHGGHPVLRWCAGCLSLKSDGNDNVRPFKGDRMKSSKRIDPIVAGIMGAGRAALPDNGGSVYEERGIVVI